MLWRTKDEVPKLIGGPGVFICDACVALCNDIRTEPHNIPAPPL